MRPVFCSLFLAAYLLSAQMLFGQNPDSTQQSLIGTFEKPILVTEGDSVKNYVGQVISIVGPVVSMKKWEGADGVVTYLDMFQRFPNNPFSIIIYRQHLPFFEPIEQYEGSKVRLTGRVRAFKDKKTGKDRFSIELKKPEQIEILKP